VSKCPQKKTNFGADFFPEDEAEYEVQHNPGSDFLPMLKCCAEAQAAKFNAVFTAYSRNPISCNPKVAFQVQGDSGRVERSSEGRRVTDGS
jgi:hypothetical protein